MIKNFDSLADRLKGIKLGGEDVTPEKLIAALKDEKEYEIEAGKVHLFTDEQVLELKTNTQKTGYSDGVKAGEEMFAKNLKRAYGLSGEEYPGKDIDSIKKIIDSKVLADAKIEPEKKVKELSESLSQLQNKYQSDINDWTSKYSQKENEVKAIKGKTRLMQAMPKVEGYKVNHLLAAFESDGYGIQFDDDGKEIPTLNGKPVKDAVENYESIDNVVNNWLSTTGFVKQSSGRGGSNEPGGNFSEFKTDADVFRYMEKNNINPDSTQGKEILEKYFSGKK